MPVVYVCLANALWQRRKGCQLFVCVGTYPVFLWFVCVRPTRSASVGKVLLVLTHLGPHADRTPTALLIQYGDRQQEGNRAH